MDKRNGRRGNRREKEEIEEEKGALGAGHEANTLASAADDLLRKMSGVGGAKKRENVEK